MTKSATARPFGERKQRLVLYVGVLFAALAAILVLVIASNAGGGGGSGKQPVVVAKEAIPANTRVTAEMLEVKFLGADEITPEAFTARSQVINRVVAADIAAGAQILPSQVSDQAGEGLAFTVSPGMRAISIDVREVVTAGGNIQPGDQVDVVGVFEVSTLEGVQTIVAQFAPGHEVNVLMAPVSAAVANSTLVQNPDDDADQSQFASSISFNVTVTLVENMKVLALAQTLVPEQGETGFAGEPLDGETAPAAATATLEVTPEQAQKLVLANQYGALRLALRGFNDASAGATAPMITVIDRGIE